MFPLAVNLYLRPLNPPGLQWQLAEYRCVSGAVSHPLVQSTLPCWSPIPTSGAPPSAIAERGQREQNDQLDDESERRKAHTELITTFLIANLYMTLSHISFTCQLQFNLKFFHHLQAG